MLNPSEHIWSAVKADIKRRLRENFNVLIMGDPTGKLSETEFRLRFLENTADVALQIVTPDVSSLCEPCAETLSCCNALR